MNVNFHFINRTNGTGNFTATGNVNGPGYNGNQFATEVINTSNYLWANNHQVFQPIGNNTAIPPLNLQLSLKGVYYRNDDVLFNHDTYGTNNINIYNSQVQNGNNTINIFFTGSNYGYDGVTDFYQNK